MIQFFALSIIIFVCENKYHHDRMGEILIYNLFVENINK